MKTPTYILAPQGTVVIAHYPAYPDIAGLVSYQPSPDGEYPAFWAGFEGRPFPVCPMIQEAETRFEVTGLSLADWLAEGHRPRLADIAREVMRAIRREDLCGDAIAVANGVLALETASAGADAAKTVIMALATLEHYVVELQAVFQRKVQ